MHREALGTYKEVFEHMGVLGHQGISECKGTFKHMGGVNMPQTYGGVKALPSVKVTCH